MCLPKRESTWWLVLANTTLSVFDTHIIKEKTMEENTRIEQPLNLDEEQLQDVTGGAGSYTDQFISNMQKTADEHIMQSAILRAQGNHDEAKALAKKGFEMHADVAQHYQSVNASVHII